VALPKSQVRTEPAVLFPENVEKPVERWRVLAPDLFTRSRFSI
jgi:hypothetical protein